MSSIFKQALLDMEEEIATDGFAGGGGASLGYEMATGRPVDVAMNHDANAVAMHRANHPGTLHLKADIFEICPIFATQGRPVGFSWFSPDCTYFSKARGEKPIRFADKRRRSLSWVVARWAGQVAPRVIGMENVLEIQGWGPLVAKRCPKTGRVVKLDKTVAAKGERVPIEEQALVPDPKRKGQTYRRFVRIMRELGYEFEWREMRLCDFGAPTIRKRWFAIARRDGRPIVWPEPSHGKRGSKGVREGRLLPYRTIAEGIDWGAPMLSIFATREEAKAFGRLHAQGTPIRPLAENTQRRIARGVMRYVLGPDSPFLVALPTPDGVSAPVIARSGQTNGNGEYVSAVEDPLTTATTKNEFMLASPVIGGVGGRAGQSPERTVDGPSGTITVKGDAALFAPIAVSVAHGEGSGATARRGPGQRDLQEPHTAVTGKGDVAIVAPVLANTANGKTTGRAPNVWRVDESLRSVTTSNGVALFAGFLATNTSGHAATWLGGLSPTLATGAQQMLAASFLTPRYGERKGQEPRTRSIEEPSPSVVCDANGGSLVSALAIPHVSTMRNAQKPFGAVDEPSHTVTAGGAGLSLVSAFATSFRFDSAGRSIDAPFGTVTANSAESSRQGAAAPFGIVSVSVSSFYGGPGGKGRGSKVTEPLRVQGTENRFALIATFAAQNNGGYAEGNSGDGRRIDAPGSTTTGKGANLSLLGISMLKQHGTSASADVRDPMGTQLAGGTHHGVVGTFVDTANNGWDNRAGRTIDEPSAAVCAEGCKQGVVAVATSPYYSTDQDGDVSNPRATVTTKERHALMAAHVNRDFGESVGGDVQDPLGTVTASAGGHAAMVGTFLSTFEGEGGDELRKTFEVDAWGNVVLKLRRTTKVHYGPVKSVPRGDYRIVDIRMRMLLPKELFFAQGFPPEYIFEYGIDEHGNRIEFTKATQVEKCGNSVPPQGVAAIVSANVPEMVARSKRELSGKRKEVALAA